MYQRYRDAADFYVVYIREAHPIDGRWMARNDREGILIAQPKTKTECFEVARLSAEALEPSMPMVVDRMDDHVERHYGGWPDRLYIVDRDGKIAYKGDKGSRGFKPAEMEVTLQKSLSISEDEILE